jgi:hypothetical protein
MPDETWVIEQPARPTLVLETYTGPAEGWAIANGPPIVFSDEGSTITFVLQHGVSGPPGTFLAVVGESPGGVLDGSNATFTSLQPFIPLSVEVLLNGVAQTRVQDFNTTGFTTITLTESPRVDDVLRINYLRAS